MKKRIVKSSPFITFKSSKIHNTGGFASKDIKKGTKIIEYGGKIITKKESENLSEKQLKKSKRNNKEGAVYIFELNKRYDIDGNVSWNKARLLNHSCEPNAESVNEDGHIWIISTRDIKKGEEITYDYGYSIDDYENHPCKCSSKNCVGYIVAKKYRKRLLKKLKNSK